MKANLNFDCEGIVINPWGQSFMLAKELTNMIFEADGDEMGEYGNAFSKIEMSFLEAVNMAKNSDRELDGIVINAFSEPCVFYKELFELVLVMAADNEHAE